MEQLRYFLVVSTETTRERPSEVLCRFVRDGIEHVEGYRFYRDGRHGWEFSDFFVRELFGHNDDKEAVEIPQEEAEAAIARRLQEREERGIGP